MLRISNTGLIVASLLIVTLLTVDATVAYNNTIHLRADTAAVLRSHEVIGAIHDTRSAIKDAETGQRGYLLTSDPRYAQPYRDGIAKVHGCLERLSRILADDPAQSARVPELSKRIDAKVKELQETSDLLDEQGFEQARTRLVSGVDLHEMEAALGILDEMQASESALLARRSTHAKEAFRTAIWSAIAATVASILLFGASVLLIRRNIGARTRAVAALTEQSDLLRTTVASIVEGIVIADVDGKVLFLNRVAEQMTGWSLAEARGVAVTVVLDLRDDASDDPVECTALLALRTGDVHRGTGRTLTSKTGARIAVEDSAAPLVDESGATIGAVLALRDVTQAKRGEREAAAARAYAETIVDTVPDPLVILDASLRVRSANLSFHEMFRTTHEEIVDRPLFELGGGPWDENAVRELLDRVAENDGALQRRELEHVVPDLGARTLRLNARRVLGGGQHAGLVMLVLRDVTDSRAIERRVKQLLEAEQQNADRWRQIAAASSTLNSTHSREGVLDVLRDEAKRILGLDEAVVVLEPAEPQSAQGLLSAPLTGRGGKPLGSVHVGRANGGGRGPAGDSDEAVLRQLAHVASVAIDNARLYEELREGDRRKDEFLATLAHELRNPLAPMSNSLQIVRSPNATDEDRERALETMRRQVTLLVRLVEDLLDVSRISRGKVAIKKEAIDLADVVAQALEISRPIVTASGTTLEVDLPRTRVTLQADPARIAQVLANLLNNAAKYTERDGHIWLSCARVGDEVVVRVRDDGIGIPPEMLPHVFDMFWQVEHAIERAQGGLGIGLRLVRQLVDLHGGRVEAHSEGLGRGSEFVVRLPIGVAAEPKARPTAARTEAKPDGLRILVVDDNQDSAESLALLLQLEGHEVRTAFDGVQALNVEDEYRPELVLLDIGLPLLSGHEVARRLRARRGRELTIVAMTGWGQSHDRARSQEAGFDHHLVKPVDRALLRDVMLAAQTHRT